MHNLVLAARPVRSKYVQADLIWGRIQRKTWCMRPYDVVDSDLTLSRLQSRLKTFGMGNPLPGSTLALCQSLVSRLYPVRNLRFGLWCDGHFKLLTEKNCLLSLVFEISTDERWEQVRIWQISQGENLCYFPLHKPQGTKSQINYPDFTEKGFVYTAV